MTTSGDATPPGTQRVVLDFAAELAALRDRHDKLSYEDMGKAAASMKDVRGSKETFRKMVATPSEIPAARYVRGFVLSLGLDEADAQVWEERRRRAFDEWQGQSDRSSRATPDDAGAGEAPHPESQRDVPAQVTQEAQQLVFPHMPDRGRRLTPIMPSRLVLAALLLSQVLSGDLPRTDITPRVSSQTTSSASAFQPFAVDATGQITCVSGAPVTGVFIETLSQDDRGWASVIPTSGNVATYTKTIRSTSHFAVRVGCGGTGNKWLTDNRSRFVSDPGTSFVCHDEVAVPGGRKGPCEPSSSTSTPP